MEASTAQGLHEGIAAAKAGQRELARSLLTRATQELPDNIAAWLWLSGVLDVPEEQARCLQHVLALDPEHGAARRGLAALQPRITDDLLIRGIAAAEIGRQTQARTLLLQVTERDEENVLAWLWLSRVMETLEDRKLCLENVLALDAAHTEAREELAAVECQLHPEIRPSSVELIEAEPPSKEETAWKTAWARYENIYACPYCTAPTKPDDRRCATCNNPLWMKTAQREKPSLLYWVLWSMQAISALAALAAPLWFLSEVGRRSGHDDFMQLLPLFIGGKSVFPPEIAVAILQQWPRWLFFASWIPVGLALGLFIAIALRWAPVYYLLLINAVLTALLALAAGLLIEVPLKLAGVVGGFIFALAFLLVTLRLEADFVKKQTRILLQVDRDVADGADFFARGERYAAQRMWALAAIHLRRAAAQLPGRPAGYLALARVCLQLGDFILAAPILENLRRMSPQLPEIAVLETALRTAQGKQG